MDPNAAYSRLLDLCETTLRTADTGDWHNPEAVEMAEIFAGLDEWIKKGGFLPDEWKRGDQ